MGSNADAGPAADRVGKDYIGQCKGMTRPAAGAKAWKHNGLLQWQSLSPSGWQPVKMWSDLDVGSEQQVPAVFQSQSAYLVSAGD